MYKYKILLKDGTVAEAENKWLDLSTIFSILVDHQPFIQIGNMVVTKDAIAIIEELETEEKEN